MPGTCLTCRSTSQCWNNVFVKPPVLYTAPSRRFQERDVQNNCLAAISGTRHAWLGFTIFELFFYFIWHVWSWLMWCGIPWLSVVKQVCTSTVCLVRCTMVVSGYSVDSVIAALTVQSENFTACIWQHQLQSWSKSDCLFRTRTELEYGSDGTGFIAINNRYYDHQRSLGEEQTIPGDVWAQNWAWTVSDIQVKA